MKYVGTVSNTEAKEHAKFRGTAIWKDFRAKMIMSVGGECELCGTRYTGKRTRQLNVHHIDPVNYYDLTPTNYRVVCSSCHDLIERMLIKKSWGRYTELWHGLLDKFLKIKLDNNQ